MIECVWSEARQAFEPTTAYQRRAASERFGDGEVVPLDVVHPRSKASHDQFFALVAEAHGTLPDHLSARLPTPDSLRHYALCEAGYCDIVHHACASHAEALRWLPRVQAMAKDGSQIAVVGSSVVVRSPHSQSMKAMGGKVFQESKSRCLEVIADLLDVPVAALGMARAA
jgi:hypothetical protein